MRRLDRLEKQLAEYRFLCAELLQVMRAAGAPERVMVKLIAAATAKPIPALNLLPITASEFTHPTDEAKHPTPSSAPPKDTTSS